ncbi:nmrA-like family protein [Truncatella angustata]|uniref:NmrA-like family protein n=1 Tax=Truncatella angustata TaxID=152316 RepID=A0A9P8RF69_9PEZI|nr:nmrA-like family protein [Truncatella angustata]KAH6643313.1 nmrA-like family protein [Truncatella angustata]
MVKVAIAGGTGAVGRALVDTIAAHPIHKAVILSRQVNYHDVQNLVDVLVKHQIHTVICAFGITGTSLKISQMNLIKAAALAAPACRFIPTSYSIDYPRDGVKILPPLRDYFDCLDELDRTDLEWSVVLNGLFLDYYGTPHLKTYLPPNAFIIDMLHNAAAIPGTGDEPVSFTYTFDVAKFLVAALDLHTWPRELRVVGDEMSINDLVRRAEATKGVRFEKTYDSVAKLKRFEITELPQHRSLYTKFPKERFQWFQSIFEMWVVEGKAHVQLHGSLNENFPDLKPLKVEGMLERCWKRS